MSKVLYIKANAKPAGASRTFQISDAFIEAYKKTNPSDEIITLDLYHENIHFINSEDLGVVFAPKTEDSKNHAVLKYTYQFFDADKYVFAAPMWNLSVPAIMKAYIDYITIKDITFHYTENGPEGLCKNKKAIHITTRGGDYSNEFTAAYEMGDRYLKTIFGFLGVTDFLTITAENLDLIGQDVEAILNEAKQKAIEVANQF